MEIKQLEFLKHLLRIRRHVYLDHNATTSVSRHVRRKMSHVLKSCHGNPSALYRMGRTAAAMLEQARQHVADAIHARPGEVYFTSCATESNNAVLFSLSDHFFPEKKKIISTPIEHPSVMRTLEHLKTRGIVVEYCPVDGQGRVLTAELQKMIDEDTFLICCLLANNEIGTIQDIVTISRIAARSGVLVFSDCVQALGKIAVDVQGLGIDYASFSAHKLHGPKGVGALYVRQGRPFAPLMHGGHQENSMRAGTESLHNIAGFGVACQDVPKLLSATGRIRTLKDRLIRSLMEVKADCVVNGPERDGLANTLSITLPGMDHAELLAMLDHHGIAVSAASACSALEEKPSPVLLAIGLSAQAARETIRISLGHRTSARDIRCMARVFRNYVAGRTLFVNMITPAQLTEAVCADDQTCLLDVRPQYFRRKFKSLPNSLEVPFARIEKYLSQLPREKHIVVVCQHGNLSYIMAYYLKSKGFHKVSSLRGGLSGWKRRHDQLYQKYAGRNVTVLHSPG